MKGLLLKDLYVMRKYNRSFIAMTVIFLLISAWGQGGSFLTVYPVLMASIISTSILSYDEKFRWNTYCDTMPCTRRQVVSEKYLLTIMMTGSVFIINILLQLIPLSRGVISREDFDSLMAVTLLMAFVAPCLMLPVIFKLGMEKGRIAYYVVFGIVFVMAMLLPDKVAQSGLGFISGPLFIPALLLVCVIAYAISWALAVKFYENREL